MLEANSLRKELVQNLKAMNARLTKDDLVWESRFEHPSVATPIDMGAAAKYLKNLAGRVQSQN
jgi:hypothetical protein